MRRAGWMAWQYEFKVAEPPCRVRTGSPLMHDCKINDAFDPVLDIAGGRILIIPYRLEHFEHVVFGDARNRQLAEDRMDIVAQGCFPLRLVIVVPIAAPLAAVRFQIGNGALVKRHGRCNGRLGEALFDKWVSTGAQGLAQCRGVVTRCGQCDRRGAPCGGPRPSSCDRPARLYRKTKYFFEASRTSRYKPAVLASQYIPGVVTFLIKAAVSD